MDKPNSDTDCSTTVATSSSRSSSDSFLERPIVLSGYLRMLKNSKKKYFVLRGEAPGYHSCLEYYSTQKKFQNKQRPKGSISLNSCININKVTDAKEKNIVALFTRNECFYVVLETEKELIDWLNSMLLLQNGGQMDGKPLRPRFEHMWQVNIKEQELCKNAGVDIKGHCRLFLNHGVLGIVKEGQDPESNSIKFPFIFIKRCGFQNRSLFFEMGRLTVTGPGELWVQTEDNSIALSIHNLILKAMTNLSTEQNS